MYVAQGKTSLSLVITEISHRFNSQSDYTQAKTWSPGRDHRPNTGQETLEGISITDRES